MSVYLQNCEPNSGCKNLEKIVFTMSKKISQNQIKQTKCKMKQPNGYQTKRDVVRQD